MVTEPVVPDPLSATLPPCAVPLAATLPEAPTVTFWAATVTEPPTPDAATVVVAPEFTLPSTAADVAALIVILPP